MTRGPYLDPRGLILVAFWISGPGLRGQWDALAHLLEKGVKKITNGPPTGAPNGTVFGRVSIFLLLCRRYCGSLAKTGSWLFFSRFVWESGKRNMDLTSVFTVPNTHHIFGSRTGFSYFLVPSEVSFGGCWIGFWCVFGGPLRAWRRPRLHHIFDTILGPFLGIQANDGKRT